MAPMPAAKFIPEFALGRSGKEPFAESLLSHEEVVAAPPNFASAATKTAPRVEDAYRRGLAAGKEAAYAEIEAKFDEERSYHAQQLALERYTWADREAEKLAGQIGDGLREITAHLGDLMARILRTFLTETAHRQAIAELFVVLESMLGKQEGITLEISGPEDLLQLLREKLSSKNVAAVFTPTETVDVRIVAGQTILETCIGTWMHKVKERMQ